MTENNEQKFVLVPVDLALAIGQYLLTCPMGQVEGLVTALRKAQTIEAKDLKEKPAGDEPAS